MSKRCEPGCGCGKHTRPNRLTPEQREERAATKRTRDLAALRTPAALAAQKERNHKHGHRYHLKSKFGITPERWDEMYAAQEGCCYLCSEPLAAGFIHIDHDHSCCRGVKSCGTCIRGLACQWCNQGVGQFGDDPERMRRVADSLEMANRRLRETAVQLATR